MRRPTSPTPGNRSPNSPARVAGPRPPPPPSSTSSPQAKRRPPPHQKPSHGVREHARAAEPLMVRRLSPPGPGDGHPGPPLANLGQRTVPERERGWCSQRAESGARAGGQGSAEEPGPSQTARTSPEAPPDIGNTPSPRALLGAISFNSSGHGTSGCWKAASRESRMRTTTSSRLSHRSTWQRMGKMLEQHRAQDAVPDDAPAGHPQRQISGAQNRPDAAAGSRRRRPRARARARAGAGGAGGG